MNTTFEVQSTLKGKAPDKKITIRHFRLPDNVAVNGGPHHVSFRDKRVEFKHEGEFYGYPPPDYLLFLKASKDPKETRYEPVSGQVFPDLSVREMFPVGLADTLGAKK